MLLQSILNGVLLIVKSTPPLIMALVLNHHWEEIAGLVVNYGISNTTVLEIP